MSELLPEPQPEEATFCDSEQHSHSTETQNRRAPLREVSEQTINSTNLAIDGDCNNMPSTLQNSCRSGRPSRSRLLPTPLPPPLGAFPFQHHRDVSSLPVAQRATFYTTDLRLRDEEILSAYTDPIKLCLARFEPRFVGGRYYERATLEQLCHHSSTTTGSLEQRFVWNPLNRQEKWSLKELHCAMNMELSAETCEAIQSACREYDSRQLIREAFEEERYVPCGMCCRVKETGCAHRSIPYCAFSYLFHFLYRYRYTYSSRQAEQNIASDRLAQGQAGTQPSIQELRQSEGVFHQFSYTLIVGFGDERYVFRSTGDGYIGDFVDTVLDAYTAQTPAPPQEMIAAFRRHMTRTHDLISGSVLAGQAMEDRVVTPVDTSTREEDYPESFNHEDDDGSPDSESEANDETEEASEGGVEEAVADSSRASAGFNSGEEKKSETEASETDSFDTAVEEGGELEDLENFFNALSLE